MALVQFKTGVGTTATVTCTFDAATTAGNRIVLGFASDDYNGTPGAGWLQETGCEQQTFHGGYVWHRLSAGETSFQYVIGSATNSAWVIAEFSEIDAAPYLTSNGQFVQSGASDPYTTPSITPPAGAVTLVAFMGASNTIDLSAQSWGTWVNSFTPVGSKGSGGAGTNDLAGLAYRRITADGTTSYSSGATASVVTQSRSGIIIAFKEGSPPVSLSASSFTSSSPTVGAPSLSQQTNVKIITGGTQAASAINGGAATLTLPTLQQGDVVIVFGGHFIRAGGGVLPTGFTSLFDSGATAGTDPRLSISYKVMGAVPDTTVSCPGSGNVADGTAYGCYCLRDVDTSAIIDADITSVGPTTSSNPDCPSITTVTNGALVLAIALDHIAGTGDTTITNPTNYIEQRTARGADNNDATVCGAALVKAIAGAEDPSAFTAWTAGTWRAATVAIRPVSNATAVTGSNLVTTATVLPAATIAQTHALSASTLTTTATVLPAGSFVRIVPLSTSSLTTTAPTIAAGTLVHVIPLSASSLTTTAASAGAPAIVRFANFTASTLTTTAVSHGASSVGAISNLSPSSFTETVVSFTSPTVGYKEGLSPAGLTTTAVSFTAAAASIFGIMTAAPLSITPLSFTAVVYNQTQALSPSSITTTAVSFASVDFVRRVDLSPPSLTLTAPSIAAGTLAVVHPLATDGLVNGDPTVTWIYALSASNITTASPTINAATFNQSQSLSAGSLTRQATEVTAPTFMGIAHITASVITTASPDIGAPDVHPIIHMVAADVTAAPTTIDNASINQRQALGASVLSTGPPTFPNLQIFLAGEMAAANLVLSFVDLGAPEFVERASHLDASSFAASVPTFTVATIHQSHVLSVDVITTTPPEFTQATIEQTHTFAAVEYAVDVVIDAGTFSQTTYLDVDDFENDVPNIPAVSTEGVGVLSSIGINKTATVIGAPSLSVVSTRAASNLVLQSPQFTAAQFRVVRNLDSSTVVINAPIISAGTFVAKINLDPASFARAAAILTDTDIEDFIPTLYAVITIQAPTIGAPLFRQEHILTNVSLGHAYPTIPSPILLPKAPIETVHITKIVGVKNKASVAGVATYTKKVTVSGRPLPASSRIV